MWIYSKTGQLLNCDQFFEISYKNGRVSADHGVADVSDDAADLNRIYNAMNAGVAVLDLRGEQHG